ncbi:MAG: response regulator [Aggregatilineales bacterium]
MGTPITPRVVTTATLHDLRTPIQMILGYCDILLNSVNTPHSPLPIRSRADVASIERNARQLQTLIDQHFVEEQSANSPFVALPITANTTHLNKTPVPETADQASRQTILVLHHDPLAAEWARHHMPGYSVVWIRTIAEMGRLSIGSSPVALVVTEINESRLPEIAAIVGDDVPILEYVLPGTQEAAQLARGIHYLIKPVTYEVLAVVFAGFDAPLRDVLIIDDDQDNANMIGRMLADIDATCTVWKAYSGREGLALMREQTPSMVILDLRLPDISGLTIVRYMRTVPQFAQIPVLLVSASRASDMPVLSLPNLLSVSRLSGFSSGELGHLLEALIAINVPASQ